MPDRLEMLRNAVLLEKVPQGELEQLAALVRPVQLGAGATFSVRGQPSPGMVLVETGSLEVLLDATPICSLSPGSVFCEEALVSDAPSPATLRAPAPCALGVLERSAVEAQIDLMPRLWEALDRAWRHRVLAARLYSIELFRGLPAEARIALADLFEEVDLPPGAVLARAGETLDCFWVVREGQAEVVLTGGDQVRCGPLRAGDSVGDLALVHDFPQQATVSAPYGLRAMKLSRAALQSALPPDALAQMRAMANRREESIF